MKKVILLGLLSIFMFFIFLTPQKMEASLGGVVIHVQNPQGQPISGANVDVTTNGTASYTYEYPGGGYYEYNNSIYLPCSKFAMVRENSDNTLSGVNGSHGGITDGAGNKQVTSLYTPHQRGIWGLSCYCNWTGFDATGSYVGFKVTVWKDGYYTYTGNFGYFNDSDTWTTVTLTPVPPPTNPDGYFEGVSCDNFTGWAMDLADQDYQSYIHLYETDNTTEWHNARFIGQLLAKDDRSDLTTNLQISNGNHGFSFPTSEAPDWLMDGEDHYIWAYAFTRFGVPYMLKTSSGIRGPRLFNSGSSGLNCDIIPLTVDCPTCNVAPPSVTQGDSVTISWGPGTSVESFDIKQQPNGGTIATLYQGAQTLGGSLEVVPTVTTTFSLEVRYVGVTEPATCLCSPVPVTVRPTQTGSDRPVPPN